jgi:hypothetical protein
MILRVPSLHRASSSLARAAEAMLNVRHDSIFRQAIHSLTDFK